MAEESKPAGPPPSRRATLIVSGIAALFVVMPFLFWHSTWFGRSLTDEEITQHLADEENPRKAQHALAQVSQRMSRGQPVEQWYPEIVALSRHPLPELRLTAAWVMGQDPEAEPFHQALLALLDDPEPLVRRNAALSLAAFEDPAARPVLRAMLEDFAVTAPAAGIVRSQRPVGEAVRRGTLVAQIEAEGRPEPVEVRSPVPGTIGEHLVSEGEAVEAGAGIALIAPDSQHVFEALRALYIVGRPEDLPAVKPYLRPANGLSSDVVQQARLTADQIRSRNEP